MTEPSAALLRGAADVARTGWDDEADVVVVGYGCAGASAALGAREADVDVLVLERASGGGGTSATSGGLIYLGGGTATQKLLGFEDAPEEMFKYLMAAFLAVFAATMALQFAAQFLEGMADWREEPGGREPAPEAAAH